MQIGFCGALTLLFIALKLCGTITWSWLWVLSPLWIGLSVGLVAMAIFSMVSIILLTREKKGKLW
jgi:hypothetical protein